MEKLAGDLHYQPGNDAVRNRYLVNIASLQFGEEVAFAHFEDTPILRCFNR